MSLSQAVRSTGLILNAGIVTGGRAVVELFTDGSLRYAVGHAYAPVDISSPVTTRARAVAMAGRNGSAEYRLTQRALTMAADKRSGLGKYASVADAIKSDNRMDRFSKHDKATLIRRMNAHFEA